MLYYLLLFFMIVFPAFWLRAAKEYSWEKTISELLPKRVAWKKEILGGAKLFALLFLAFIALSVVLSLAGLNDLEKVNTAIDEGAAGGAITLAVTMGIAVFIEEYFFRAFLMKRIGIILSTIVFALLHFGYGSMAEIAGAFALGLILAYWYKKQNSLIQNYIGHMVYNTLAVALYLAV